MKMKIKLHTVSKLNELIVQICKNDAFTLMESLVSIAVMSSAIPAIVFAYSSCMHSVVFAKQNVRSNLDLINSDRILREFIQQIKIPPWVNEKNINLTWSNQSIVIYTEQDDFCEYKLDLPEKIRILSCSLICKQNESVGLLCEYELRNKRNKLIQIFASGYGDTDEF
ncbi:hypothetical protein [uncultured Treponema sp.]|uniref:hypothetical protein n=1 Tax=uncultured Treponema sp. TaxID=162155 RepID=UPI0015B10991|nr:hypothetical protein [uncultured Treponema sp.]